MKVLVILQTMYSRSGTDTAAPLMFRINPLNKSGKKMLEICGSSHTWPRTKEDNDVWFTNVSSICAGGGAESKRPIDLQFVRQALKNQEWDLVVFGGKISTGVYKDHLSEELTKVILMPHPAARSFTNALKDEIKAYIQAAKFDEAKEFKL